MAFKRHTVKEVESYLKIIDQRQGDMSSLWATADRLVQAKDITEHEYNLIRNLILMDNGRLEGEKETLQKNLRDAHHFDHLVDLAIEERRKAGLLKHAPDGEGE